MACHFADGVILHVAEEPAEAGGDARAAAGVEISGLDPAGDAPSKVEHGDTAEEPSPGAAGAEKHLNSGPPKTQHAAASQMPGPPFGACSITHYSNRKGLMAGSAFFFGTVFLTEVANYFLCTSWRCWGGFFAVQRTLCSGVVVAWLVASWTYSRHHAKLCAVGILCWILPTSLTMVTGRAYNPILHMGGVMVAGIILMVLPGAFTSDHRALGLLLPPVGLLMQPTLKAAVQRIASIGGALPYVLRPMLLPVLKNFYSAVGFGAVRLLVNRLYVHPTSMVPPLALCAMLVTSLEAASLATCLAIPALHKDSKGEMFLQLLVFLTSNGVSELSSRLAVPQGTWRYFRAGLRTGWEFQPLEDAVRRLKLQISYLVWPWPLGMILALVAVRLGDAGNKWVQWAASWELYVACGLYLAHQVAIDLVYIRLMRPGGHTLAENWALAKEPGHARGFLGAKPAAQAGAATPEDATPDEDTKKFEFPLGCRQVPMPTMAIIAAISAAGSIFAGTLAGALGTCATGMPPSLCSA